MKIFGGEVIAVAMLLAGATGAGARTVVSQATGEPYAGVGIVNRNLGTVTDSLGRF